MSWYQLNPELMAEVNANDRAPLKVPVGAITTGGKSRWSDVMTIVGTEYEEMKPEAGQKNEGDLIGQVRLKLRVSEAYATDPANKGRILSATKRINYTQMETKANSGQVEMSKISLRQLSSLLMALGVITSPNEIKSMGEFFAAGAAGNGRVIGASVIAQIEHGANKQGEPQQEPVRFAPFQQG